jgi:flagellar basal-body rod modification protein FlgD
MDIAAVSAAQAQQAAAAQQSQSKSGVAASALAGNMDMFLTLLTTQLKNQDPTNPMKSEDFTQQLVQMSSVEQAIQTNSNLETLISASAFQASATAINLIGKEVEGVGGGAALKDGAANWNITLNSDAPTTTVNVLDKNGATVFTKTISGEQGSQAFTWDGKNQDGVQQDDGTYFLQVTANDANGAAVGGSVTTKGIVTAVDLSSADPLLTVNGAQINYSKVLAVGNAPTTGS